MKINLLSYILAFAGILAGCDHLTELAPQQEELITNPSFERNGQPSLDGWTVDSNINITPVFSADVPSSGGKWSVVIAAGDRVMFMLHAHVTVPAGQHPYHFSIWGKCDGKSGYADLALNGTRFRSISIVDTTWTLYEADDALEAVSGDEVTITLTSHGSDGTNAPACWFDLCRFNVIK